MTRARAVLAAVLALGLSACSVDLNTAYGNGSIRPAPLFTKRATVKRTEATATAPATEDASCEGGACLAPPVR